MKGLFKIILFAGFGSFLSFELFTCSKNTKVNVIIQKSARDQVTMENDVESVSSPSVVNRNTKPSLDQRNSILYSRSNLHLPQIVAQISPHLIIQRVLQNTSLNHDNIGNVKPAFYHESDNKIVPPSRMQVIQFCA